MKKENHPSEHPIDAYFRRGLEEHRTAPSPEFWARFEVQKPATSRMPWRRAAGFLLMIGLGGWLAQYGFFSDRPVLEVVQEEAVSVPQPTPLSTETLSGTSAPLETKARPIRPVLSSPDPRGWRPVQKSGSKKTASTETPHSPLSQTSAEPVDLASLSLPQLAEPETPIRFRLILPSAEDVIAPLEVQEVEPYDEQLKTYAARSIVQLLRGEPVDAAPKPQLPLEELRKPVRELFAMQRDLSKRFTQPRNKADQPQTQPEP